VGQRQVTGIVMQGNNQQIGDFLKTTFRGVPYEQQDASRITLIVGRDAIRQSPDR